MSLLITDHFATAIHVIKSNRMRSFLTTLGIAIGIASITAILSLTTGVKVAIDRQIDKLDQKIAVVKPHVSSADASILPSLNQRAQGSGALTESDIEKIQQVDKSLRVAPVMLLSGTATMKDTSIKSQTVLATSPDLAKILDLKMKSGQFLENDSSRTLAIIGEQMAIDLFGVEDPIGRMFTLRKQPYTVIGVLDKQPAKLNYLNIDYNHAIIVSFDGGKRLNHGYANIEQIMIGAPSRAELTDNLASITKSLKANHSNEEDFVIIHGSLTNSPGSEVFDIVEKAMAAIAMIALIVGGIGIMNIMLVSVSERTREIGIRKSVGASNGNILSQFLVESLLISFAGGVSGALLGVVAAFSIGAVLDLDPVFTWKIAVAAVGTSLTIGILFGLYPALKASRKDPINSLRQLS